MTLRGTGIQITDFHATPQDYQGYFLSSDDRLNRIWYAGAYTAQLCMITPGSPDGGLQPVIVDGAKRDRLLWAGDLAQAIPAIAVSFGAHGADYIKQSLAIFARGQLPGIPLVGGAVPGFATPDGVTSFYSVSYSTYFVLDLAAYYRYTGDLTFARAQYGTVQRELAFNRSLVDTATGLMRTPNPLGNDRDPYDGAKDGAVTEYNALYHQALLDGATLADATGHPADATTYRAQAAGLRTAINDHLYNSATGVYDISDIKRGTIAQDANVAAILYGIAPAAKVQPILDTLRAKLWNAHGSLPYSADSGYSTMISPFVGGFELAARFTSGDTANALDLIRREWGPMVEPGPQYTGAL